MKAVIELTGLFFSAFCAATLFPAQSEALLVALHVSDRYTWWLLLIIASVGNVLGAVMNWVLGRYLIHFQEKKWFPLKGKTLDKAMSIYQKYGIWTLLFAWLPVIGDPLTLVAGILRANIWIFLLFVAIGKVVRYALLLAF